MIGVIIGGHPSAHNELQKIGGLLSTRNLGMLWRFGVNHAVSKTYCDFMVSHHPEIMDHEYPTFRGAKFTGFLDIPQKVEGSRFRAAPERCEGWLHLDHNVGSSALLAVHVARAMRCEKIILCGVHLNDPGYSIFRKSWEREAYLHAKYLRSMGGWTCRLFGPPSREWLEG